MQRREKKTMIKPEIKLIKQVEWKHTNWLMKQIDEYQLCDNDIVTIIEVLDPVTKKQLEIQCICATCGRNLAIYGKNQNTSFIW
jgi:hypothetical protein